MPLERGPKHSCGEWTWQSVRGNHIWICSKCQVDIPREEEKKKTLKEKIVGKDKDE